MKTLAGIVIVCALVASIAAMVIAFRTDQSNTIAVATALIVLMTLIVTVALQPLAKSRGLMQDQIEGALRHLESDVRKFWNAEADNRGLVDNPIQTELRTAPASAEADSLPAAEPGKPVERRSGRGVTAWFG